jgi:hypothetical protein
MSARESLQGLAEGRKGTADANLKKKLLDLAATRSPVVRNGRFFFHSELNALTFWYEDQTHSTRMVFIKSEA